MQPSYLCPLNSKSPDQITHLFFKNLQLNSIQNSFENFKNLIHLDLSRNNLGKLPDEMSNYFSPFFLTSKLIFFFFFLTNRISEKFITSQHFEQ